MDLWAIDNWMCAVPGRRRDVGQDPLGVTAGLSAGSTPDSERGAWYIVRDGCHQPFHGHSPAQGTVRCLVVCVWVALVL